MWPLGGCCRQGGVTRQRAEQRLSPFCRQRQHIDSWLGIVPAIHPPFVGCRCRFILHTTGKDTNKRVKRKINRDLFSFSSESIFTKGEWYELFLILPNVWPQKSWKRQAPSLIFLIESHRGYMPTSVLPPFVQSSTVTVTNLISAPSSIGSRLSSVVP